MSDHDAADDHEHCPICVGVIAAEVDGLLTQDHSWLRRAPLSSLEWLRTCLQACKAKVRR